MTTSSFQWVLSIDNETGPICQSASLLEIVLRKNEYETLWENHQAVSFVCFLKPDVIVWNMDMLLETDFQMAVQLKTHPATQHIPIIVLSAVCDETCILRCYQTGLEACVVKPHSKADRLVLDKVIQSFKILHSISNPLEKV